jgi:hypothetical protein
MSKLEKVAASVGLAGVVAAGTLGYVASRTLPDPTAPAVPVASPLLKSNKPPVSSLVGYIDKHTFFPPPKLPTNAPNGFTIQWSTNLSTWWDITNRWFTNHATITDTDVVWVVYSSNFATHIVKPTETNTEKGPIWNFLVEPSGRMFFRWRVFTNANELANFNSNYWK